MYSFLRPYRTTFQKQTRRCCCCCCCCREVSAVLSCRGYALTINSNLSEILTPLNAHLRISLLVLFSFSRIFFLLPFVFWVLLGTEIAILNLSFPFSANKGAAQDSTAIHDGCPWNDLPCTLSQGAEPAVWRGHCVPAARRQAAPAGPGGLCGGEHVGCVDVVACIRLQL